MSNWTVRGRAAATLTLGGLLAFAGPARTLAQVSVLTYHNDNARTGFVQESQLTPANVDATHFGRLFHHAVDGYVYAQPLYVPNVAVPGEGTHNLVYVATEHDSIYAFDADDAHGSNRQPLWHFRFLDRRIGMNPVPSRDTGCSDLVPQIGITGTPVIDPVGGTLFLVTKSKEQGQYVQRLHALDVTNGHERFGGPIKISASLPGSGDGSSGGMIAFDPLREHQRPGLLLVNGIVYISWASHCDNGPYHGWVIGYDANTLAQVSAFVTTPNGGLGGIWQSGGAPAADAGGNIYAITGNGTFDADSSGSDYGDTFLKLSTTGGLSVADYFTPFNAAMLEAGDVDLGSGGALLLPDQVGAHPHLVVGGGKEGTIYLVDRDGMGHFNPTDDSQIVQSIPAAVGGVFSTPAYWNGTIYFGGSGDALKAFPLSGGLLSTTPASQASTSFGFPGATPSVSANGTSDGIVWAIEHVGSKNLAPAVLHAYDATDLSHELYNSTQKRHRDAAGGVVKFAVPTIANGKVYVAGRKRLTVYGLL